MAIAAKYIPFGEFAHRINMVSVIAGAVAVANLFLFMHLWLGKDMPAVMVRYPPRIAEKTQALKEAAKAGIELGSWFDCPLHPMETPLASYDYEPGMCLEAEEASHQVVNLPLHPRVSQKTAVKTIKFTIGFTQVSPDRYWVQPVNRR